MMNMKKLLFLSLLLAHVVALWAQAEDPKQRISEVKQSEGQYIYADKTCGTVEKALEQAQELLLQEVMNYLKQSGEDADGAAAIVRDQMVTITVQRGDKFRAFVYIDKRQNNIAESPKEPEAIDTTAMTALQHIASMTNRLQVYDYIMMLQKEGEKVAFVSHPEAHEMESMYMLLYKRGGDIKAILTPPDAQGQRYNIVTGQPDTQANHPGTSVNGFVLN